MKKLLIWLFISTSALAQWSPTSSNFTQPQVGQLCPQGSTFDGANCFLFEVPQGSTPFIHRQVIYYTAPANKTCIAPTYYDGANCHIRPVPAGYDTFFIGRKIYTHTNYLFVYHSHQCPAGSYFDGANCNFGRPVAGREASFKNNHFTFKKGIFEKCKNIDPSSESVAPTHCAVKSIPQGHVPFIHLNGWYTSTTAGGIGDYWLKSSIMDANHKAKILCENFPPKTDWELDWSDEFEPQPDNKRCYSSNDLLHCVYATDMSYQFCKDAPTNWTQSALATLPRTMREKYAGLKDLNKCHWSVHNGFNTWEHSDKHPLNQRSNDFRPENVQVKNGVLELKTVKNPRTTRVYDCGRPIEPSATNDGRYHTNNCPFSGGNIMSPSITPWYDDHSPNHNDPTKRYVGRVVRGGRIEFRVNIKQLGHGAWPSVWLFTEKIDNDQTTGLAELDNLEFIGHHEAGPDMFKNGAATYGMAHQTVHNWGVPILNYPHVTAHKAVPIGLNEWHTYSIEFDQNEIRVYIDNCLTKRLVDGTPVPRPDSLPIPADGNTETYPFKVPGAQTYKIIIGNPASEAPWHPAWYRANGGPLTKIREDFKPTIMEVDYVRFYRKKRRP